ncbi:hypothetical protein EB796_006171 [Bugula neritina]|uniref:lysozyme n=1 Tax=Bugula neritina TaxID=10212 RepID=A0A7J7KC41_BUGNE|nr:hypothetical protein EB796_006171 [Bugula neritina]
MHLSVAVLVCLSLAFVTQTQAYGWKSCAASDSCSRTCVRNYMSRYASTCARHLGKSTSQLTCQDYGRLHNGGPSGCSKYSTLSYAAKISSRCGLS